VSGALLSLRNTKIAKDIKAELMITAISKDARGRYLASTVDSSIASHWAIGHDLSSDALNHDSNYAEKISPRDFEVRVDAFNSRFHQWLEKREEEIPHIFLDISCMSRPSMAEIFSTLFVEAQTRRLSVTVGYVIAAFTPPPENLPPNEDIRPVSEFFAGWPSHPSATTALIVGLGYEREKAEGACEYFDSNEPRVFIPSSPIPEYDQAVEANNAQLLASAVRRQHAHAYKLDDPEQTFGQLISVVSSLVTHSNPVILPFGPKIFFALSLIAAEIYKEIGVWYVTGDTTATQIEYEPSDHAIGFRVELGPAL
jgi:hypothetical protein